jgi:hypothetical protein
VDPNCHGISAKRNAIATVHHGTALSKAAQKKTLLNLTDETIEETLWKELFEEAPNYVTNCLTVVSIL